MRGPFRIEGYAIVCSDGAIADATGFMPDSLKLEADQRFFVKALGGAAVVVHGRMSHEGQPNSPKRRRLILTRRVKALAPDPNNANARFWNPAGASLEEACAAVGLSCWRGRRPGRPAGLQLFSVNWLRQLLPRSRPQSALAGRLAGFPAGPAWPLAGKSPLHRGSQGQQDSASQRRRVAGRMDSERSTRFRIASCLILKE